MNRKTPLLASAAAVALALLVGCATQAPTATTQHPTVADKASGMQLSVNTSPPEQERASASRHLAPNLEGFVWTLTHAQPADGSGSGNSSSAQAIAGLPPAPEQPALVLRFDGQQQMLAVQGLCNRLMGSYSTQAHTKEVQAGNAQANSAIGGALHIQPLAATLMACPEPALMQLEQQVSALLPQAQSWHIRWTDTPQADSPGAAQLQIDFAQGQRWLLQGQWTHEALYGQPQRMFLEVAPEQQACNHPLMGQMQCLQTRIVHYEPNGRKTLEGAWGAFYDPIEGYSHQAGTRHVLRLKRYTRQQVPADASQYVYVLDMIVESETRR